MKLYYVAHCRFPSERAHAIQIAKMTEAMRLSGVDVHLILPRRKNHIMQSPHEFYGLKISVPLHYLPICDLYRWGKTGYFISGLSFLAAYWFFLFWKRLRGEHFSLYTIDMDQFSFIGVSFFRVPFIMEIHDTKKYGMLLHRMFTRARAIITINTIIKRELVRNFDISPEKVVVCPNGIDRALFSQPANRNAWRARWHIAQDARLVLYVGKCYAWKGMEILDGAFRALPRVTFAFVGCTREEVEKVTGTKCDYPNVLFFGQCPYVEMPQWMKSADMLLLIGTKKNEYSYYHTSPMKLFEYMATGIPILAAHTPAVSDTVSEREVFFYEPDNAQSFVGKIQEIFNHQSAARKMASATQQLVSKFSWENRAKKIVQSFDR